MEIRETLIAMREILTPDGAWCQGAASCDASGLPTRQIADAVSFCISGASVMATRGDYDFSSRVVSYLSTHCPELSPELSVVSWNDDKERTQAEVLAFLDDCIAELTPEPLIPNAETIEALEAAEHGEFSGSFNTVEELMADLHSELEDA